jgi:hypothetical protein
VGSEGKPCFFYTYVWVRAKFHRCGFLISGILAGCPCDAGDADGYRSHPSPQGTSNAGLELLRAAEESPMMPMQTAPLPALIAVFGRWLGLFLCLDIQNKTTRAAHTWKQLHIITGFAKHHGMQGVKRMLLR